MKHHDPARPIGKCKGCCLNSRSRCAAGLHPKLQWSRGRCTYYGDRALLERTRAQPLAAGAKLARRRRQARATIAGTEPHYNGLFDARKVGGRADRRRH